MRRAVIFDLDGVIVSTDQFHYESWKTMADKENIEFNHEINNRLRGVSRRESLDIILEKANRKYSAQEKDELMKMKNDHYILLLQHLNQKDILPGILDLLEYLKMNEYKLAIGSSSKNARLILHRIGLENHFDVIVDGTLIKESKPSPEVFLQAAQKLEIAPQYSIVVEDAFSGVDAAKAAGMKVVALGDARNHPFADVKLVIASDLIFHLNELFS